jgi:hypothetical protein
MNHTSKFGGTKVYRTKRWAAFGGTDASRQLVVVFTKIFVTQNARLLLISIIFQQHELLAAHRFDGGNAVAIHIEGRLQ